MKVLGIIITLNPYLYANAAPVNALDPSGKFIDLLMNMYIQYPLQTMALTAATAVTIGYTVKSSIDLIFINREINYSLLESAYYPTANALTPAEEKRKNDEYLIMKGLSDMWTPPPGNDCSRISKEIYRAKAVITRYKLWDKIWLAGRHAEKIQSWENRLKNLKEDHQKYCTNN